MIAILLFLFVAFMVYVLFHDDDDDGIYSF